MIKKATLAAALMLGLTGCQMPGNSTESTHQHITKPVVISSTPSLEMINNCDNSPETPCISWDEQEWRLVASYDPYTFQVLPICPTEDSDRCVWGVTAATTGDGNIFININDITYYLN